MKWNHLAKSLVLGLAVLLATSAFASNKGSLHLQEAAQVNGQKIPAGDYDLRWEGAGPDVELSIMKGKTVVTKTSAKVVERNQVSGGDAVVMGHNGGTASLTEVRFAGKKIALAITESEKADTSGNSSR